MIICFRKRYKPQVNSQTRADIVKSGWSFFAYEWTQTLRDGRQISDIKTRFQCWFQILLNFEKVSHLNDSFLHSWMWNQVVAFISSLSLSYNVVDVYVMPHIINWGALQCRKQRLKVFSALFMRVVVNWRFAIQQTSTIITRCVCFLSSPETFNKHAVLTRSFFSDDDAFRKNLLQPKNYFSLLFKAISNKLFTQNLNSGAGSQLLMLPKHKKAKLWKSINREANESRKFLGFLE